MTVWKWMNERLGIIRFRLAPGLCGYVVELEKEGRERGQGRDDSGSALWAEDGVVRGDLWAGTGPAYVWKARRRKLNAPSGCCCICMQL